MRAAFVGAFLGLVLLGCSGKGPNDPGCNMMMCPTPNCGCLTQSRASSQVRERVVVNRLRNGEFVDEPVHSTASTTVSARRQGAQR